MSSLPISLLALVLTAAQTPASGNPVLQELLDKGVKISDGSAVRVPAPFMADGLDAAGQRAVIDKLAGPDRTMDDLARRSLQAPVVINTRSIPTKEGGAVRVVDAAFIVYGDWNKLQSSEFLEGLLRSSQQEEGQASRSGVIPPEELAKRGIKVAADKGVDERFFYSTVNLLDRIQVSNTRRSTGTRGSDSMVLAAEVDSRFNGDPQYPNEWRPLTESPTGQLVPGKASPYDASGFYVKATKLVQPAGAVFVEYHMVFEEPYAWFKGGQALRSKLPLLIQDEVRNLRRRLSRSEGAAPQ